MAQHYRNTLRIVGPKKELDRVRTAHLSSRHSPSAPKTPVFDFSSVIPPPAGLSDPEAPFAVLSHDLYFGTEEEAEIAQNVLADRLSLSPARPPAQFKEDLKDSNPGIYNQAKTLEENAQKYGVTTLAEWKIRHWGCTGAHDASVDAEEDALTVYFDTDDAPPLPLLLALSSRYPALRFELDYFETVDLLEGRVHAQAGRIDEEAALS